MGLGLGFLGGGTEFGAAAAAAAAIGGALCKQIREANHCSDGTMDGVRVRMNEYRVCRKSFS